MISLLIVVIVVGLLVWLALWALGEIGIPEPFNKIAKVLIIVIAVIYILNAFSPFLKL